MKRFLFFLFLFFALSVRALATDVTIGAMTVDGFSPTAIGNDRLIAVSASGGSPTVTSAGLFTGIVGLSGFRVLIDGTQYTVASVASTSSLTLTTNYSGTPGAQVMTLYRWVEMRVYADRAFQPLGSTQIVQPGTVGSGNFFRRFGASVVNNGSTNQLFIPQIVLPATTDALITNQAKYTFPFYTPGGAKLEFFLCPASLAQLRLPPATPTTWTAICSFNSASAIVAPNREAYSKAEIDARLPSCTLNNGVFYSASGNILSCLTFGSGFSIVGSTLEATAGGSGYNRIQEEAANLAQRAILNFTGTSLTCVDNAGDTRTDCSADPDLNALASIGGTGFSARTAADTWALRSLTQPAAGLTITNPAGVAGNPTFALANDLNAVEGLATTGLAARTASDTWTTRTITQPAAGITVTNGGGVAGNPTLALANDLNAVEGLGSTGLAARTATDTWAVRSLTQPAAGLTITNPAGIAGNPTFALANDLNAVEGLSATGAAFRTGADTWAVATGVSTDGINVTFGSTNLRATRPRFVTSIDDTNGNELLAITATGSAVNEISITNAATGEGPTIAVSGGDANPNLNINAKGTGRVVIKGYPYTFAPDTSTVGNVGGGLDNLHSFSLAAGSLASDGDFIDLWFGGSYANTEADKQIQILFDGQTAYSHAVVIDIEAAAWEFRQRIIRLSATTVRVHTIAIMAQIRLADGAIVASPSGGFINAQTQTTLTVSNLNSNAVTIQVKGEGSADNDVTQNLTIVQLVQR